MSKFIFLDVDGVLNCHETFRVKYEAYQKDKTILPEYDHDKILLVKEIIDRTGAKLVLSSTWRIGWAHIDLGDDKGGMAKAFSELAAEFRLLGIEFHDRTPIMRDEIRGTEIKSWLHKKNKLFIESFIILDDDSDMGDLISNLVKTDTMIGLTHEHVERAIRILGEKEKRNG